MSKRRINKLYDFMTIVSDDSVGEIWIHGDITDEQWFDTDVTPKYIRDAINDIGPVATLNIRVNSYGGSVIAGNAIISILDSYKRKNGTKIHAYIEGIAASMGSGIPMVADYIYMASNAMFMIHKPYSFAIGNADDMEHEKMVLEKVEDTLIDNYMRHFKGTEDELRQMMADETWLTADEALEYGFCDEIIEAVAVAASAKGIIINGHEFQKAADVMKDKFKENKGESTVFEYDESLAEFDIDEETFNSFDMDSEKVLNILRSSNVIQPTKVICVNDEGETGYIVYTKAMVQDAFGTLDISGDDILDLAKKGKEGSNAAEKAKAYDKMVSCAIDKAIASGIKAKGDDFKESKWRKILSSLDYDEIVDQMHEWDAEAKIAVKAGKRVAEPWEDNSKKNNGMNPDDYNIF